jgi:hypothetical protein
MGRCTSFTLVPPTTLLCLAIAQHGGAPPAFDGAIRAVAGGLHFVVRLFVRFLITAAATVEEGFACACLVFAGTLVSARRRTWVCPSPVYRTMPMPRRRADQTPALRRVSHILQDTSPHALRYSHTLKTCRGNLVHHVMTHASSRCDPCNLPAVRAH